MPGAVSPEARIVLSPDERALGAVMARYGLEMDMSSVPILV